MSQRLRSSDAYLVITAALTALCLVLAILAGAADAPGAWWLYGVGVVFGLAEICQIHKLRQNSNV